MRADTITLSIEEKFTAEEKAEIAEQLARAVAELETICAEKKVSDASYNERIKRADAQITEHAKRYNKGCEKAQIGCDIRYDVPEPGKKSYVRMDTAEVVEVHDMTWDEKQDTIQFPLTASPEAPTQAQPTDEQVDAAIESIGEDVTRLCSKTPGCIHFADHDGPCEMRQIEPPTASPDQPTA